MRSWQFATLSRESPQVYEGHIFFCKDSSLVGAHLAFGMLHVDSEYPLRKVEVANSLRRTNWVKVRSKYEAVGQLICSNRCHQSCLLPQKWFQSHERIT